MSTKRMKVFNRTSLIIELRKKTDLSENNARYLLKLITEEITAAIERGEKVKLQELGTFELHRARQKLVKSKNVKIAKKIPEHNIIAFIASPKLKAKVRDARIPDARPPKGIINKS